MKKVVNGILGLAGLELRRKKKHQIQFPVELNEDVRCLIEDVLQSGLTMTWYERLFSTALACKYVVDNSIPGDFVECGVWRGGNAILAAGVFKMMGAERKVILFDTFEGMTVPTEKDVQEKNGESAFREFQEKQRQGHNEWCYASLEDVKANFKRYGLLDDNVIFIKGDVLETLSAKENLPDQVSVLRLDTDWYESTKKELQVLYPILSENGVIIVDDYGAWKGAKQATDEYFNGMAHRPFLSYIDHTGRIGIKPSHD